MEWQFDYRMLKARTPEPKGDIVFIHGFAVDNACFIFIIDKFTNYNLYFLNLPGHGNKLKVSTNKREMKLKLRLNYMANYVVNFLKTMDLKNIILVGHSMGGAVASLVENRARDRIKKLILISPMNITNAYTVAKFRRRFFPKNIEQKLKMMTYVYKVPRSEKNLMWMRINKMQLQQQLQQWKQMKFLGKREMCSLKTLYNVNRAQKKIRVPLMVCLGVADELEPFNATKRNFLRHHPNAKIVAFRDSGHMCFEEETFKFAKEVKDFIEQ